MEEEMNKLTLAIEDNPNLSESFKGNLVVLANTVIATFPQYDYSYFKLKNATYSFKKLQYS